MNNRSLRLEWSLGMSCIHGITIAAISASVGCGSVNRIDSREQPASTSVAYVTQVTDALGSVYLKARDVRLAPTRGGQLQAQVDIENRDVRTRCFKYRFDWLDENGSVIESKLSSWMPAEVPAGGIKTIRGVAPVPSAVDFRLQTTLMN